MSAVATITETVLNAAQALRPHSESPRLDAEVLLGKVLRLSRALLIARDNEAVAPADARAYGELISRARTAYRSPTSPDAGNSGRCLSWCRPPCWCRGRKPNAWWNRRWR